MNNVTKSSLRIDSYGDVLLPADIQSILRIGRTSVYHLLDRGDIRSIRVGAKYLIPKLYLLEFLDGTVNGKGAKYVEKAD